MKKHLFWPAAFVVLWSTGFIGARYCLPDGDPLTLLTIRFLIAATLLFLVILLVRRLRPRTFGRAFDWPSRRQAPMIALVGVLMHGVYLGAVFVAMSWRLEAGAAAVIAGLSPIFTALGAMMFLGEPFGRVKMVGMALGITGVALVVAEKLGAGLGAPEAALLGAFAPLGFAAGALLQKRLGDAPIFTGTALQYAAAALMTLPLALLLEPMRIDWTWRFSLGMAWLVFSLSFGAIFLLYFLLRRGAAGSVASLTFLVPGSTAIIAWALFGETLGPTALIGLVVAAIGVALVTGALRLGRARLAG